MTRIPWTTRIPWEAGVLFAGLMLASATGLRAQAPNADPASGQVQGGGRGRGRFGQIPRPVQGTVTAVAGGKVTVKTDAGETYEITAGQTARVMRDRQPIQISDIKPGDQVTAMGQVDAAKKTVDAIMLMDVDAATLAKAKENLGKTYITGRITAIDADNLKLTVERQDRTMQVIAVDEGTSFQRGMRGVAQEIQAAGGLVGGGLGGRGMGGGMRRQGAGGQAAAIPAPESITLADVRVGDTIAATGTMKNGVFTAMKMGVTEPGAGRRNGAGMGGGQPDGGGATPPAQ